MKKPRHLSKAEREVWDRVARTAKPIDRSGVKTPQELPPPPPAPQTRLPELLPTFRVGSATEPARPHDPLMPLADRLRSRPVSMDAKNFGRMTRGKIKPEGRIDLHGMTLDQAHPALNRFILDAVDRGRRLVLVITGKGRRADAYQPYPQQRGILRQQVPHWLGLPPLAAHILEIRPAHQRHGGDGAYYVYLRRNR